jgi:hypothetical protein
VARRVPLFARGLTRETVGLTRLLGSRLLTAINPELAEATPVIEERGKIAVCIVK